MTLADEGSWSRDRLDADYTARLTCTEAEFLQIIGQYDALSASAKTLPGTRIGVPYDPHSQETLDLYGTTPGTLRPCFVFIHGGYWRALSKDKSAFMAPMLSARGIACAVPDYTLAPAVSMTEIVRQCRTALAYLWQNAESLGIDRARIVVGGSSAGGHLAAAIASPGWQAGMHLPDQPLKGALPVSGLFELAPIAGSHVQDWMNLAAGEIDAYSPLRHLPSLPFPCTVALAQGETPGFHRQSAAYAAALGAPVLTVPGRNHFDVILDWTDPNSDLSKALFALF
ncbi:MAG: alpha/beta hydrolase [Gemmobacter sp.]|nr:alpha/beta hydrolase [Gemmobacter sp.]